METPNRPDGSNKPDGPNDIEKRILEKMAQGAERIGYSLEKQQKDRDSGMSEQDIMKKCERYTYIHRCISGS